MAFTIQELPFFALLILQLLPLTIAVIVFIRIIELLQRMIPKIKEKAYMIFMMIGELLIYLTIFVGVLNIVIFLIGEQPPDFSLFEYLIEDTLPNVWYMMLLYGILTEFTILLGRRFDNG